MVIMLKLTLIFLFNFQNWYFEINFLIYQNFYQRSVFLNLRPTAHKEGNSIIKEGKSGNGISDLKQIDLPIWMMQPQY